MRQAFPELLLLAWGALRAHRLRSTLSVLGVAVGIAAVVLLTSIGEGTRRHVLGLFTQFGTNLMAVSPGKARTLGVPGVLGGTTHKLTIDDAMSLHRVPGVERVVPVAMGTGRVEWGQRGRSVFVYGATPDIPEVWQFHVRSGSFWPPGDPRRGAALAVLGPTLARELFGETNPLGQVVRIAGGRFRVTGVMAPKGQMLGFDIDDAAYVPVASALDLFNLDELIEIDLTYAGPARAAAVEAGVKRTLAARHGGNEDFTIITQAAMLEVFGNVMGILTLAVSAIGGVSLVVGATGILTMMWIAVGERTAEIGLARAVGASRAQVQALFLSEAAVLSALGGGLGAVLGLGLADLLRAAVPGLPLRTPPAFLLAALLLSLAVGLLAGVLPARRAAGLDPVEALRAE
jgi:putative ABC transport system permease protein